MSLTDRTALILLSCSLAGPTLTFGCVVGIASDFPDKYGDEEVSEGDADPDADASAGTRGDTDVGHDADADATDSDGYDTDAVDGTGDDTGGVGGGVGGGDPATDDTPDQEKPKFVGNITTSGRVRSDFVQYWDQITPENEGKWGSVEGSRDNYNWSGVRAAYDYAKEHNILFKQHTFIWGSQYPSWINNLSASEQAEEIEEWIKDFCTEFPDTDMIDVVNEATPGHAPAGYAKNAFGNDWITEVFKLAQSHCPNAILILNDYNVLSWDTDKFIAMAKPAVDAGVVDAIGCQAHGLLDRSLSEVRNNLNKVVALGLPIYISEYDLDTGDDQKQRSVMEEQFTMLYEHPSVKGITLWGYVHGKTWRPNTGLIYDDGTARPAMTWLMDYLGR